MNATGDFKSLTDKLLLLFLTKTVQTMPGSFRSGRQKVPEQYAENWHMQLIAGEMNLRDALIVKYMGI